MNKIKKLIIILLFAIISIIIILLLFIKQQNKDEYSNKIENKEAVKEVFEQENMIHKIDTNRQYFYVKECIEKYKQYATEIYNMDGLNDYQRQISFTQIKSLIPEFVINDLGINNNNIIEKLGLPDCIIRIDNIYVSKQTINQKEYIQKTNINAYIVEGIIINPTNGQIIKNNYKLIAVLDELNERFLIIPQEYMESKGISVEEGKSLRIFENEEIEDFQYNGFYTEEKSELDMAKEYFNLTKYYTLYDIDYLYNKMSEEYRNKRFGNIETYRKYIKDNYNELQSSTVQKYLVNNNNGITQYVIKDQYENLYIFDAKSILDFTIKLDTYTIEEEKFKTTYENSNSQQKVQMNIDKFFQMINRQDYQTSYNVLDEQFRMNKLKSKDNFDSIMKNRLFKYNIINFVDYKDLGSNTYSYTIKLTDLTKQKNNEISMNIIMQLKEGTDFVMSFSFN